MECPNCRSRLIQYAEKLGFECANCGSKFIGVEETAKIVKIPKKLIRPLQNKTNDGGRNGGL